MMGRATHATRTIPYWATPPGDQCARRTGVPRGERGSLQRRGETTGAMRPSPSRTRKRSAVGSVAESVEASAEASVEESVEASVAESQHLGSHLTE